MATSSNSTCTYPQSASRGLVLRERDIEEEFIEKLRSLKYTQRPDIRDRAALERNFRQKFEALSRVSLTDAEFQRLLDELITPDVFTAARVLREKNDFTRDDGTPLSYTLVNIKDWCSKNYKTKFSCAGPGFLIADHFPDVRKMAESSTAKPIEFDGFGTFSTRTT